MMKTKIYTALITLAVLGMCFSCTDINHLHEPYLERGGSKSIWARLIPYICMQEKIGLKQVSGSLM